jgi:hypothetical protein
VSTTLPHKILIFLVMLALESADVIGGGDGELGLELLGSMALMQMSVSKEINPRRIGSLQSWNEPLPAELGGDAVTVDDGLLGIAGRDVGDNGGVSRYHKLDAS